MAVASASTAAAPAVIDVLVGDPTDPNPHHLLIFYEPPCEGTDSDPNLVHSVKNNIHIRDHSRSRSRDKRLSQKPPSFSIEASLQ